MKKIFSILCLGIAIVLSSCNGIGKKVQDYETAMKEKDFAKATEILSGITEKELTVDIKKQIRDINDEYYTKDVDAYLANAETLVKEGKTDEALAMMAGTDATDFSQKQLEKTKELSFKFTRDGVMMDKNVEDAEGKAKYKNVATAEAQGVLAKYIAVYNELMGIVKKATPENVGKFTGNGSISKYGIGMELDTTTPDAVTGKYWYSKYGPGNSLTIKGVLDGDNLKIEEFDQYGMCTGRFDGKFDGHIYEGTWINPRNGQQMSFKITYESNE